MDIARDGGFTTSEVGRLIGRSVAEVSSWLRGHDPLILSDYEPLNGRPIISFAGLVEARAIAHFLEEGFDKGRLKTILRDLRREKGERHPLARDLQFVTDGFRLFETDGERLINIANDVYAESRLMKPALKGHVVFRHGKAAYLEPDPVAAPLIRIDPRHAFGRPVVVEGKLAVTTAAIAGTAEEEGLEAAAEWFGISAAAASQAINYERSLAS